MCIRDRLIGAYKNENRTLAEKQEILDKLAALQPDYFSDLDAEGTSVDTLKGKYDELFQSMLQMAKAKAFMAELNRIEAERVQILLAQDAAQAELDDINAKAAAGDPGYAPREQTFFQEDRGSFTKMVDPKYVEKSFLRNSLSESNKDLKKLETQAKRLEVIMGEGSFYDLLIGSQTKTTPSSNAKAIQDQLDIMEKLSRELKIIEERQAQLGLTDLDVQKEQLKAYTTAFNGLIEAGVDGADVAGNIAIVGEAVHHLSTNIGRTEDLEGIGKVLSKLFSDIDKAGTLFGSSDQTPIDVLAKLKAEFAATGKALQKLKTEYPGATEEIEAQSAAYLELAAAIKVAEGAVEEFNMKQEITEHLQRAVVDGSFAMGSAFGALADSTKDFGQAMLEALTSTLSALIRQIYMTYALETMKTGADPLTKIALLGVGAGAISGFLNSIPKLAQGGIAVGPQLAMVGDNRSGREAIIPLEKLPGLMQKMGGGNGGRLYGTIQGYDLVLSNERNNRLMQRASR